MVSRAVGLRPGMAGSAIAAGFLGVETEPRFPLPERGFALDSPRLR